MSSLFEDFLKTIPNNRSEMVNELELPELSTREPVVVESSYISEDLNLEIPRRYSADTESDISLSRAMTDSEIDYDLYKRKKNIKDPWEECAAAKDRFPPGYISSLTEYFQESKVVLKQPVAREKFKYFNDEVRDKMVTFFEEECLVFAADDPGLEVLQEALQPKSTSNSEDQNSDN